MAQRLKFKGKALRALDAWFSSDDVARNLRDAGDLLKTDDAFAALVERVPRRRSEFVYPKLGVVQGPEFERAARKGYREAIALAQRKRPPVPIKSLWATGDGIAQFDCVVVDRGDHIEVTIQLPGVDVDPADAKLELTDVQEQA